MLTIRPIRTSDAPAVSRICLLTGDAGVSAEHLHSPSRHDLKGSVYALPYVHLPHTWGFVLVDDSTGDIKGYILGATDSVAFAQAEEESWWPALRTKYPLIPAPDEEPRTEADQRYIARIHRPSDLDRACLALSPAHMHINLLPEAQRQGWGRRLVDCATEHLRMRGLEAVWLGMDPKNEAAAKFYDRVGFTMIDGAPPNMRVLHFTK